MKKVTVFCLMTLMSMWAYGHNVEPLSKQQEASIIKAVNQSFDGLVEAAKAFDFDRYLEYFDKERFTALNEDGTVVHSVEAFENLYREQFAIPEKYQSLDFSNIKITVINHTTAILVNEFKAEVLLTSGDVVFASGGGTQVWSLMKGVWKLVNVSSSG